MSKRQSAWMANISAGLAEALAEAARVKAQPIAPGFVRFERNDYHYGQQGQVTRTSHLTKDIPEVEAINWVAYGASAITWPDGGSEYFDNRVTPARCEGNQGFGTILRGGERVQVKLSRLLNVAVEYYGVRTITPEERASFVEHVS